MSFCKICLEEIESAKTTEDPDYHDVCKKRLFGKAGVSPRLDFDKKQFSGEIAHKFTKRMSMSGLQQKLSMKIENGKVVPTDVGGTHILKPTAPEYDHVSENEHVSMLIGEAFSVDTPPCGLVTFSNGELAYLVRRFDRGDSGEKAHQEDLAQIMGIQKEQTGEFKYEGSYVRAGQSIYQACGEKLTVVLRFFERVLYNFIISNSDFHLKNISLRGMDRAGTYSDLTPNYDSLNTHLHFGQGDRFFALNEGLYAEQYDSEPFSSLGFPTEKDFYVFGERLGLNSKTVKEVFGRYYKKIPNVIELVDASYLPDAMKVTYKDLIEKHIQMLNQSKGG